MKQTRKALAILLVVMLAATMFAACGKTTTPDAASSAPATSAPAASETTAPADDKPDTSKEVALNMYLMGNGAPDVEKVYVEVNKMLKEKVNATINTPTFISWAEADTKYNMILASGEDFDLIFSAAWKNYHTHARNGAFYELTDEMLKKYAPMTLDRTPKDKLDGARIPETGKLFMLPMNYNEIATHCYVVRGDIMDKYGIKSISNFDDLEKYLEACKTEGIIPFGSGSSANNDLSVYPFAFNNSMRFGVQGTGSIGVRYIIDSGKVIAYDDFKALQVPAYKKMADWQAKGFWPKDAPMSKSSGKDDFKAGKVGCTIENMNNLSAIYSYVKTNNPEWDIRAFPVLEEGKIAFANPAYQNGMSINRTSKNPERALMVLDLLRNDKKINMTTTYGIEGEYWKMSADGKTVEPMGGEEKSAGYPIDQACPWGWRDTEYYLPVAGGFPNFVELMNFYNDNYKYDVLGDFVFDPKPVEDLHNALSSLANDPRTKLLGFGLVAENEIEKILDEVHEEQVKVGLNDYLVEVQKQIDAYLASKK